MEKLKSIYIDRPHWEAKVKVDDFLISIGLKKTNSVYHVAEVRKSDRGKDKWRWTRYYLKVFDSDLPTALIRDKTQQQLIPITWYKR